MRIPTTENQVRSNALPTAHPSNVQDTSLQSLGGALQNVGEIVGQIQKQERDKADRAAFMEADAKVSQASTRLLLDPENGFRNKRGKDAIGAGQKYLQDFDTETAGIEKSLTSDRQKLAFRESVKQRRERLNSDINSHEGQERERFYDVQQKTFEASHRDEAITNYNKPERVEQSIQSIVDSTNTTPGLDADGKRVLAAEKASNTYAAVIDRYLANDEVQGAEKYYAQVKGKIGGDALTRIEAGIRTAKNRLEAKRDSELAAARQEMSYQYQDVDSAFRARVPITTIPSRTQSVALFGEQRGNRLFEEAQAKQFASTKIASLDRMTPAELATVDKSYRPSGQQNATMNNEVYAVVGRAIGDIMTERSQDPVGYLQNKAPAVKSAYERFLNDPNDATRGEYLAALNGNREKLGMSGQEILSKAEEQSVVDRMTRQSDSQSLVNSIASEQQRWGADFGRVFQQVGKDLPDTAYLIPNVSEKAANVLATVSQRSPDELKKMLGDSVELKDVEDNVRSGLDELRRSFPVEGAQAYAKIESATAKLAVGYVGQGMSPKTATQLAINESMQNHVFTEHNEHAYRIPTFDSGRPLDTRAVELGAQETLRNFQAPMRLISKPSIVEADRLTANIRENGYWVTSPDESGLTLFVDYQPVGDPPIAYTWQTLNDAAAQYRAKFAEDEALRRRTGAE